jgi:hypothetical protein
MEGARWSETIGESPFERTVRGDNRRQDGGSDEDGNEEHANQGRPVPTQTSECVAPEASADSSLDGAAGRDRWRSHLRRT